MIFSFIDTISCFVANQAIFLFLFLKQLKPATLFGNIKAEKFWELRDYGRNKNSRSAQKSH